MVKKPNGGSIAYIGSSSTTWGETGDKNNDTIPDGVQTGLTSGLCTEFFRIYGEEGKNILGEVYSDTLNNVILNHSARSDRIQCKCVQEFQLIGDPSLKIGGYSQWSNYTVIRTCYLFNVKLSRFPNHYAKRLNSNHKRKKVLLIKSDFFTSYLYYAQ